MNKKILIVDDDKDVLETLGARLSGSGYNVIKAYSGREAVTVAKKERPDLIILDIVMPGMDGGEAADILKKDPDTADIPVVFLTCLVTKDEEKKTGPFKGGKYFVAKPYESQDILDVIRKRIKD
ncbi:MAG: response regulator [Candidatus Omnitrophota bacterium]